MVATTAKSTYGRLVCWPRATWAWCQKDWHTNFTYVLCSLENTTWAHILSVSIYFVQSHSISQCVSVCAFQTTINGTTKSKSKWHTSCDIVTLVHCTCPCNSQKPASMLTHLCLCFRTYIFICIHRHTHGIRCGFNIVKPTPPPPPPHIYLWDF